MDEFRLIDTLIAPRAGVRSDVLLGIGDDAALVLPPPGEALVLALDTLVEGVHFLPSILPETLGYRLAAVNLSDLAAMGACPRWATLGLTLPAADAAWITAFMAGLESAFAPWQVALVGGDTTRGPLTLSLQLSGSVPAGKALTRHGAHPGDRVFVSGTVGDAAAGLALAVAGKPGDANTGFLINRFERPEPRLALGLALRGVASACIDVSDGLLADLGHILARSHCAARVDLTALPLSAALTAVVSHATALEHALGGGDDYELCFTVPAAALASLDALRHAGHVFTCIGEVVAGEGLVLLDDAGAAVASGVRGYRHF
jgi:thiamine-monophosphate kinase